MIDEFLYHRSVRGTKNFTSWIQILFSQIQAKLSQCVRPFFLDHSYRTKGFISESFFFSFKNQFFKRTSKQKKFEHFLRSDNVWDWNASMRLANSNSTQSTNFRSFLIFIFNRRITLTCKLKRKLNPNSFNTKVSQLLTNSWTKYLLSTFLQIKLQNVLWAIYKK